MLTLFRGVHRTMREARRYPVRSVPARLSFAVAMAAVTAAVAAPNTYAQEVGRVVLLSGNPVVGVIEELARGDLMVDTDEMGDVAIDWDDIASVTTTRIFEVTDVNGFQYFGRLEATDQQRTLVVVLGAIADTLAFSDVVTMTYIGQGFFAKTKGFVDVGLNITRANSLASLLLKGRFAYRGQLWDVDWNAETYFQRQETTTGTGEVFEEQTSRNSTSVTVKRFFGGDWAATATSDVEQNAGLTNGTFPLGGGSFQVLPESSRRSRHPSRSLRGPDSRVESTERSGSRRAAAIGP